MKENKYIDEQGNLILDLELTTPEERCQYLHEICNNVPAEKLTPRMINLMSEYLFYKTYKKERKEIGITTRNSLSYTNKREMSFEGLVSKFENGEDGIYSMIANDKNIIFMPKNKITEEDIKTVPGLKDLVDSIKMVEKQIEKATGKKRRKLIKQKIEMQQNQYILRAAYQKPIYFMNASRSYNLTSFEEKIWVDEKGEIQVQGFSLLKPECVSALLCNYSGLKEDFWDKFNADMHYIMIDLDNLIESFLEEENPIYYDIMIYKIDKKTNNEIAQLIHQKFGVKYSEEYISSIWRQKIPKMIATKAQKDWIVWHYSFEEKGKWKKCSRCGEVKLAHSFFFSKNGSSKDGWYSLCKDCRNGKTKKKKDK